MATLEQLQASREALQKEVAKIVEIESDLRRSIASEKTAAAGPQSDSEVGNSQTEGSEQERALSYFIGEIDRIREEIRKISDEIERSLGVKGGRRKTRRHRRKQRKTLRRK